MSTDFVGYTKSDRLEDFKKEAVLNKKINELKEENKKLKKINFEKDHKIL